MTEFEVIQFCVAWCLCDEDTLVDVAQFAIVALTCGEDVAFTMLTA